MTKDIKVMTAGTANEVRRDIGYSGAVMLCHACVYYYDGKMDEGYPPMCNLFPVLGMFAIAREGRCSHHELKQTPSKPGGAA